MWPNRPFQISHAGATPYRPSATYVVTSPTFFAPGLSLIDRDTLQNNGDLLNYGIPAQAILQMGMIDRSTLRDHTCLLQRCIPYQEILSMGLIKRSRLRDNLNLLDAGFHYSQVLNANIFTLADMKEQVRRFAPGPVYF